MLTIIIPVDYDGGMKSQTEEILKHLKTGRSLSPLEALEKFGCFRLGGRIYDLKKQGYNIITDTVEKNGKRFASYRLEPQRGLFG